MTNVVLVRKNLLDIISSVFHREFVPDFSEKVRNISYVKLLSPEESKEYTTLLIAAGRFNRVCGGESSLRKEYSGDVKNAPERDDMIIHTGYTNLVERVSANGTYQHKPKKKVNGLALALA